MIKIKKLKNQKGFTLIEVLVAIVIIGIIAIPFGLGLSSIYKGNLVADQKSRAMTLAESQIELVKSLPYNATGTQASYSGTVINNTGYTINGVNYNGTVIANVTYGVPWNTANGTKVGNETGIQNITVVVKQGYSTLATLSTYKINQ